MNAPPSSRPFEVTHAAVFRLAAPMALAYLSTPLVGAVDTAVIGQLGDAALIGGVAIAAVVFNLFFGGFSFLRTGTTGLTAQAVGGGDILEQQSALARALLVALAAGLAIILLQGPIAAIGFAALGVSGGIEQAARAYFSIRVWSAPFALANYAILGWVIGRGEAGSGLALQTILNGSNIALSLVFVLSLGWGVEGVALGTLLAEALTAAAGVALILRRIRLLPRPPARRVFDLARLRRTFSVNADIMIRSLSLIFAFAFFARQGAAFGAIVLAANVILMHFFLFGACFLDGFATAAEQLAGRAVGAGFRPAFERTVRLTTAWGVATAILLSALFWLAGPSIIDLMTTAPGVRETARSYLVFAAIAPLVAVIAFQMDGIFIGATWSRDMRNMMLLSVVIYLAATFTLTPLLGNHGLWLALLVFLGARSLIFHWRMRRLLPSTFAA